MRFLLLLMAAFGCSAQDQPIAQSLFEIKAQGLLLNPQRQVILVGSNGPSPVFKLSYDGELLGSERIMASLIGPGLPQPVPLDLDPDELKISLSRSLFTELGTYELRDVRLERQGQIVTYASPRVATIEVVDNFVVTEVAVERLSQEDLAEMGYLFSDDDYQSFKFNLNLAMGSTEIPISFSVAYPKKEFIETQHHAPIPIQNPFSTTDLTVIFPNWTKSKPTGRGGDGFDNFETVSDSQSSYIPAFIVIPGNVSYLKDHFGVSVVVMNQAPNGVEAYVDNTIAHLSLPNTTRFGQPLTISGSAKRDILDPGPDDQQDTADDKDLISPGNRGTAQYIVQAELEGTYQLVIDITGDMHLGGAVTEFSTKAKGYVSVKSPAYNITFEHPDTVAADDEYDFLVRLKNESNFPLNGFSITLPPETLVGCRLESNPVVSFPDIAPGEESTATYRMTSLVSGKVIASYWKIHDGPAGALALSMNVGDANTSISTARISLTGGFYQEYPQSLTQALKRYLNAGLDVAQASADSLPSPLLPIKRSAVTATATAFVEASTEHQFGASKQQTLARLFGVWARSTYDYEPSTACVAT